MEETPRVPGWRTDRERCIPTGTCQPRERGRLSFVMTWMELENVTLNEARWKRTKTKRLPSHVGQETAGREVPEGGEKGEDQRVKGHVHGDGD